MKSLLLGIAAVPFALGMLTLATGLAVVDVRQGGPDGTHIVVPVPLMLASTAAMFVDEARTELHCPKLAQYHEAASRAAQELRKAPDARLVEVEGPTEHVTIDKVGDLIEIHVTDGADKVKVRLPISGIQTLLDSYDGNRFKPRGVVAALRQFPSGECVNVQDGDDRVRIWVF